MRTTHATTALLVSGVLFAGCSDGAVAPTGQGAPEPVAAARSVPATPPTSQAAASSSTTRGVRAIPDGAWAREVTAAEITRRGLHLSPEEITGNYLDDGTARLVLKIQGSRWSLLGQDNAGAYGVGDLGTTSYDSAGRWVQHSDSTGGTLLLAWKVNADTLVTYRVEPPAGHPPLGDDVHLFLEGSWKRQS